MTVAAERMPAPVTPLRRGRGRAASHTPGHYTRAEVEEALGLTPSERDTFERAGILGPRERKSRGDTRPVLYTSSDLALAHLSMAAHRLGLRGEQLRRLMDAVRLKQRRLVPGWSGSVVLDADGDVELVRDGASLAEELDARRDVDALLVLRLTVPTAEA